MSPGGVTVSFASPEAEGGAAPVTVTCSPPSGSHFPIGATTVSCTAIDALNRTASCSFQVTVMRIPQLRVTRILAFGDSVTEGWVEATLTPSAAYPTVLRGLLLERYRGQTFSVVNGGKGGERAVDGVRRLPGLLAASNPEVLLLLDGYNDLADGLDGIPAAMTAIDEMIVRGRAGGAVVFVGTMTPPRFGVNRGLGITAITRFNEQLALVAASRQVPLVDLYAALESDTHRYISPDGRHPSVEGYQKIAETFLAALRVLDVP